VALKDVQMLDVLVAMAPSNQVAQTTHASNIINLLAKFIFSGGLGEDIIFLRVMIFEHPFYDNFCDNFLSYIHIIFTLSLYCFGFCVNTYFFLCKLWLSQNSQSNSCSNNIPLFLNKQKVSGLLSSCIDTDGFSSSPLNGLPKITKGIIGLARSNFSLPTQLALKNKLPPKFSLCLPSSNKKGFANLLIRSIGHDPFRALSKFLQATPLIVNPVSTSVVFVRGVPSNEYFIGVKEVKIDGHVLNLKPSLLSIDKKGNGGTKISTMSPFTELQNSVYTPFIRDFLKKASDRRLKRVKSVAPLRHVLILLALKIMYQGSILCFKGECIGLFMKTI